MADGKFSTADAEPLQLPGVRLAQSTLDMDDIERIKDALCAAAVRGSAMDLKDLAVELGEALLMVSDPGFAVWPSMALAPLDVVVNGDLVVDGTLIRSARTSTGSPGPSGEPQEAPPAAGNSGSGRRQS